MKILVIALSLLLGACAQSNYVNPTQKPGPEKPGTCDAKLKAGQCVSLIWEAMPGPQGGAFLLKIFRLNNADGSMVMEDPVGQLQVEMLMPAHKHHGSPAISIQGLDLGTYRVKHETLMMGGEWVVYVRVLVAGGVQDEVAFPITVSK